MSHYCLVFNNKRDLIVYDLGFLSLSYLYFSLGKQINVEEKGSTTFVRDYKLNNIQLAIRFFSNGLPLPIKSNWNVENQTILLSNVIEAGDSIFN